MTIIRIISDYPSPVVKGENGGFVFILQVSRLYYEQLYNRRTAGVSVYSAAVNLLAERIHCIVLFK